MQLKPLHVALVLAALALAGGAWMARVEMMKGEGYVLVLDRWSGAVSACSAAGCKQLYPPRKPRFGGGESR
ncbi:hypothetical protein [Parvibaculum sp. MBR-TMA-1.3b-4.2]|jgi:hypothetical protein